MFHRATLFLLTRNTVLVHSEIEKILALRVSRGKRVMLEKIPHENIFVGFFIGLSPAFST